MQFPPSAAETDKTIQRDQFPIPNNQDHHDPKPSRSPQRVRSHFGLILWIFLGVIFPISVFGEEVTLEWTPCPISDHYTVFWGTTSGEYTHRSPEIYPSTPFPTSVSHTITDLSPDTRYCFAVKSFNASGQSSDFSDEVSMMMGSNNIPPIAEAGLPQTVSMAINDVPMPMTLDGSKSYDPDKDSLTYAWNQTGGPSVILDDAHAGSPKFSAPDVENNGATLTFSLTVTDNHGETASDTTTITFVEPHPIADAGPDQDVYQGEMITLSGEASWTPGDGIATWAWVQTEGPRVELTTPDKAISRFIAPASFLSQIDLLFTLTVTDKNGLSHSDTCTVQNNFSLADEKPVPLTIFDSTTAREEWLCIGWDIYGKVRDEAHVCRGDLTGDGKSEWIIGLGPKEAHPLTPGGVFQIVSSDARHLGWGKVPWEGYNNSNGETWPACGDLNGDGRDEIIIGLGKGGERKIAIFSYDNKTATFQQWNTVPEKEGDESIDAIHPACGNIDSDTCMEIIVKLESDTNSDNITEEDYAILDRPCTDNLTDPFTLTAWGEAAWSDPCDNTSSVLTIDWGEFTMILESIRSEYNENFQDKTKHIFLGYWSRSSQLFIFEEGGL